MNFYAVLGIPVDADEEAIRHAYRILARRYHPDRGAESSSEEFRRVAEAYETLIDPKRRQVYDLSLPSRYSAVVEPTIQSPKRSFREDPGVFGYSSRPRCAAVRPAFGIESVLEELTRLFEDNFPWRS